MVYNHEARFGLTDEENEAINKTWLGTSPDLKKTGFLRRTFFLGLQQIYKQGIEKGKEKTIKKILG